MSEMLIFDIFDVHLMFFDIKFINVALKLDAFHLLCKVINYSTVGPDVLYYSSFFYGYIKFL